MDPKKLKSLLSQVNSGKVSVDEAMEKLKNLPFEDLHFAKIDHHRHIRQGFPEVIFCQGKKPEQVAEIFQCMDAKGSNILATRAEEDVFVAVKRVKEKARYNQVARIITLTQSRIRKYRSHVVVVTAGTSDIPVAEEAIATLEMMGVPADRIYDVGVSGVHRIIEQRPALAKACVVIVVAGMEGALPSVVGGLVDCPVIAVPTSIGYGASFGGITALLGMLNSCASGVAVVNIDSGFGAGYTAGLIARRTTPSRNK